MGKPASAQEWCYGSHNTALDRGADAEGGKKVKNQYVGDIGDYGKYSLLRFIALHGIKVGINWYLTDNDTSKDGKFTDYLRKESERSFDPYVYDELKCIVGKHNRSQRTVQMIQEANLIPEGIYYDVKLSSDITTLVKRAWNRRFWFEASKAALENTDLIFADPDNGITYTKTSRNKGCEKYILPEEVAQYYYGGKDVVFYCHKGRRNAEAWGRMFLQIKESICDAKLFVLTFHRGTQRSYIFVVHPEKGDVYSSLITEFVSTTEWGKSRAFTREIVAESTTNSTPDICRRMAVLNCFQKAFPTKSDKEKALKRMSIDQIDELIDAGVTKQEKIFYASYKRKRTGFAAPTIGTIYPKGSTILHNDDGTITIIPPPDEK